jgi:hypothetical protein
MPHRATEYMDAHKVFRLLAEQVTAEGICVLHLDCDQAGNSAGALGPDCVTALDGRFKRLVLGTPEATCCSSGPLVMRCDLASDSHGCAAFFPLLLAKRANATPDEATTC